MSEASVAGSKALPARRTALLLVLPPVVVAVVVGILGMHVLSGSHAMPMGTGGAATHASMAVEIAPAPDLERVTGSPRTDSVRTLLPAPGYPGPTSSMVRGVGGAAGHGMGSMMMLCVAMLLRAGATLLALFAFRRRPRMWAHLSAAASRSIAPPAGRPSTGPPPAWEFSVVRC